MRIFRVIKPYYFLAVGTTLRENVAGNYFVSMRDEDWLESRIRGETPVIDGGLVEHDREHFEEITGRGPDAYKGFLRAYLTLCDLYGLHLAPARGGAISLDEPMIAAPFDSSEAEMFVWRTRPAQPATAPAESDIKSGATPPRGINDEHRHRIRHEGGGRRRKSAK